MQQNKWMNLGNRNDKITYDTRLLADHMHKIKNLTLNPDYKNVCHKNEDS